MAEGKQTPAQEPPPDTLKVKENDDATYVTEELGAMRPFLHRLLALWMIVSGTAALIGGIALWPPEKPAAPAHSAVDSVAAAARHDTTASTSGIDTLRTIHAPNAEAPASHMLLILCLLFGILGGSAHGLSSLMDFRGQRRLFRSWTLWYFGRPILGGMMAVIFYVVVRAGLFASTAGNDATNLYGIAAFSALTGMFTDAATNKLADLFETLFSSKQGAAREGKLTKAI